MLMGPFLDRYISANWVFNYDWNVPALTFLALSCACAVGVNISQFMCLGRFTAVSYQVPARMHSLLVRSGHFNCLARGRSLQMNCCQKGHMCKLAPHARCKDTCLNWSGKCPLVFYRNIQTPKQADSCDLRS